MHYHVTPCDGLFIFSVKFSSIIHIVVFIDILRFCGGIVFYSLDTIIYPFIGWWIFGIFHFSVLWVMLVNHSYTRFVWTCYVFNYLCCIPRSRIVESYIDSIYNLLKNCQAIFCRSHTNSSSHQHYIRHAIFTYSWILFFVF
jgi:hypothetical protein